MATEKQIAANRLNAQLSSGPRTEAGKNVSRMNALRHGLTAQIEVTTPGEKEAKDRFFDAFISSLAPEGSVECQFAHSVADGHWRLNRASSIENNIFTLACSFQAEEAEIVRNAADGEAEDPSVDNALDAARVFIADPKRFQLLTIYEGRIHRAMMNNLRILREMQATRRALETRQKEEALEEACLLSQLAEMEDVPYDPATDFPNRNGFVPTTTEITQAIRRTARLKTAKQAESSNWNPTIRRAA